MLDKDDGKRIWRHFQRFSEYEDLKNLYQKFMPFAVKFENTAIDVDDQINDFKIILRDFDEKLMLKVNKVAYIQY